MNLNATGHASKQTSGNACRVAAGLALVLLLAGCAVGNKIQYANGKPTIGISGTHAVAVASHDQRPYVVSGDKPVTFVGLQRGGFGNPFNVTTASGGPLADDFSTAIQSALDAKGYSATVVRVTPSESQETVASRLRAAGAERQVWLTLREWKSDTFNSTALIFDVSLRILDGSGAPLADESFSGREDLGGSMLNPPSHAKKAVPDAFRRKLEEWFSNPEIVRALQ